MSNKDNKDPVQQTHSGEATPAKVIGAAAGSLLGFSILGSLPGTVLGAIIGALVEEMAEKPTSSGVQEKPKEREKGNEEAAGHVRPDLGEIVENTERERIEPSTSDPQAGNAAQEWAHEENTSTEGQMLDEEETSPADKFTLPLKHSGNRVNIRRVLVQLCSLEMLLEDEPCDFQSLLALAQGQTEGTSKDVIKRLRQDGLIAADGSVRSEVRDTLLSAYRETSEGPVLANPFNLEGENDLQKVAWVEREIERTIRRTLNDPNEKG